MNEIAQKLSLFICESVPDLFYVVFHVALSFFVAFFRIFLLQIYKISAVVSEEYVMEQTLSYAGYMGLALLICAAAGVALILLFTGVDHLLEYVKRRKEKNDRAKYADLAEA